MDFDTLHIPQCNLTMAGTQTKRECSSSGFTCVHYMHTKDNLIIMKIADVKEGGWSTMLHKGTGVFHKLFLWWQCLFPKDSPYSSLLWLARVWHCVHFKKKTLLILSFSITCSPQAQRDGGGSLGLAWIFKCVIQLFPFPFLVHSLEHKHSFKTFLLLHAQTHDMLIFHSKT